LSHTQEPDLNHKLLSVDDYLALPVEAGDWRISYGNDPAQFGDLYLPQGEGPHPLVVLLHGGCWRATFDLAQLGQMARALTATGAAVWNLEYRRVGNGGGWPNTFLDVADGADHLRSIANEYDLDLNHVVAAGHSAGGHLALWLAARRRNPHTGRLQRANPLPIHGVVSLAGIPDLGQAAAENICRGMVEELMGGAPGEAPDRYSEGSPAQSLPLDLPHIHINGDQDDIVPLAYVDKFVKRALQAGDRAELMTIDSAGHFEIVVADLPVWAAVRAAFGDLFHSLGVRA
jgi:acetyl esterase/lipase